MTTNHKYLLGTYVYNANVIKNLTKSELRRLSEKDRGHVTTIHSFGKMLITADPCMLCAVCPKEIHSVLDVGLYVCTDHSGHIDKLMCSAVCIDCSRLQECDLKGQILNSMYPDGDYRIVDTDNVHASPLATM